MTTKIEDLGTEGEVYEVEGKVVNIDEATEVAKKDGHNIQVQHIDIADVDTEGATTLRITLWADNTGKYIMGDIVQAKGRFEKYRSFYQMTISKDGYIRKKGQL